LKFTKTGFGQGIGKVESAALSASPCHHIISGVPAGPLYCAATIAGSAQLPEDKRKYTFEVFYNQCMYGINQACLRTGAFDLLEQFRAGKYE
jgi:hypothetical protein